MPTPNASKMPPSGLLRLSPSKVLLWAACKRHAQIKILNEPHEDRPGIHAATGTAAHAVLEAINKGASMTEKERDMMFRVELEKTCIKQGLDLEFVKSYKESKIMLRGYEVPAGWSVASAERKHVIQVPEHGFEFAYVIDLTLLKDGGDKLRFIDYKSSAAPPSTTLQLVSYAWAESRRLDDLSRAKDPANHRDIDRDMLEAAFWMTRDNRQVEAKLTAKVVSDFEGWLFASVDLMRATWKNGLDMDATGGNCKYCPMVGCASRK